ncbi:hypothetical protein M0L20_18450 [Spirosoma sp. RP8]|uniref:DUF4175 domain-containing protein n=1 Tax=Spirosoma liriopis TaxID=2937440 RepID=A0ABT0HNW1_9BACT|nr:hypothetical protein [Spirosoma liriopis]MCK8493854.1 hypothetical protein [Spirosoma liriopis]
MTDPKQIISSVSNQLYANALLRCLVLAASAFLLTFTFTHSLLIAGLAGLAGLVAGMVLGKLFEDKKPQAVRLIHQTVGDAEYSLPLLEKTQLNVAEQLQLERLHERIRDAKIPTVLFAQLKVYALILLAALAVYVAYPLLQRSAAMSPKPGESRRAALVTEEKPVAPSFESAQLRIQPPAYTQLPERVSSDLNASSINGSMLTWRIAFSDSRNVSVRLVSNRGVEVRFKPSDDGFVYQDRLINSGLYAIKAYWSGLGKDSLVYQSDFYRLEAQPDLAPKIVPESKELYRYHYLKDPKNIALSATMSDDFKVIQAFIVATVARGSGENVKFREVKMPLDRSNFKEAKLTKQIDLKALNFAPGDELYYYWAAFDNRQPEPNFTKSDTYFLVYKDTTKLEESELATMAVNIMPEYFRSQRQIIIDTEKLIAKRKTMADKANPNHAFKSASNEIGFDQKALRLRYGQFLGEEFEKSIGGDGAPPIPTNSEGVVVAGMAAIQAYMHKHDEGEGEQTAAPQRPVHSADDGHNHGGGGGSSDEGKDPVAALMEQYVHNHDDAETNTFHEQSTRSLLKMALEQMWESELHLRMYEPEKALPYEKKALEYLKLSQQKARSFVKKTGFDPPPIKEQETRLTGELKNVNANTSQQRMYDQPRLELLVGQVLGFLSLDQLNATQRQSVQQLGNTLADRVVNSGLTNWSVLTGLQKLAGGKPLADAEKKQLKTKLYELAGTSQQTNRSYTSERKLERSFWRHLQ